MKQYRTVIFIIIIVALALWIVLADQVGFGQSMRATTTRLGLDLIGGVQVLLEGEIPDEMGFAEQDAAMNTVRTIIENRVNGLGVSEAVVVRAGDKRIVVELPGIEDPEQARATIKQTALLEFVDMSSISPEEAFTMQQTGMQIETDHERNITETQSITSTTTVWHTIMTGGDVKSAFATTDPTTNEFVVAFELQNKGAEIFKDFTSSHVGQVLAIVLDKQIISAPVINSAILGGEGTITGNFDYNSANQLAVQISYGALPIPLQEVETRTVGPSLGQDSLQKSLVAGIIGFTIVILFMGLYYRLPGIVADIAIIIYAILTFALYQYMPVVLTLPGIAGFLLSTGSALDANILIFERMKEELRSGRSLQQAVRLGWDRAWPSIRDSNFATLITCAILYFFGSTSGATIVKGFSVTLLVGIFVSLFTAIVITRTLLTIILNAFKPNNLQKWFGI